MRFEINSYDDFKIAVEEVNAFLLAQKIAAERIFDSKLVLHELLGNVLQHSQGGATLGVELLGELLQLSIRAEEIFCPPERGKCPERTAERGRGLYLVDCACEERIFTPDGEILVRIRVK